MNPPANPSRAAFATAAARRAPEVVALTQRLTAIASPNPPGDVRAAARDAGRYRLEGKSYLFKDGDVALFRFTD